MVTGDALYAQENLSWQVVEQGSNCFWVVKDNRPQMREGLALLFAEPPRGEELAVATQCGRWATVGRNTPCGPLARLTTTWTGPGWDQLRYGPEGDPLGSNPQ